MTEVLHLILKDIVGLPVLTQITAVFLFMLPVVFSKTERLRAVLQIFLYRIFNMNYKRNTKISLYANSLFRSKGLHLSIVQSFRFSGFEVKTDIYKLLLKCIIFETDKFFQSKLKALNFNEYTINEIVEFSKKDIVSVVENYSLNFEVELNLYFKNHRQYRYDPVAVNYLYGYILTKFKRHTKVNINNIISNIDMIAGSSAFTSTTSAYHFILENIQQARHRGILHSFVFFENMNGYIERTLTDLKK